MRQTIIDFGPLRLWGVVTNSFNQEQVYTPGNTDVMYSKFTISVSGLIREWGSTQTEQGPRSSTITPAVAPEDPPTVADATPSTLMANAEVFRYKIGTRKEFRMWIGADAEGDNGTIWLWARPYADSTEAGINESLGGHLRWFDCDAGPKCTAFQVDKILAGHATRVTATFEVCIPYCDYYPDDTKQKILLNKWSVSDSVDQDLYTTRTYRGQIKVANPHIDPNLLRGLVLPPLAQGMRRAAMDFAVEQDGRTLAYTIVDREATFAAPIPATSWNVTRRDDFNTGRGTVTTTAQISLTGERNVNKKTLTLLAVAIAEELIPDLEIANGNANEHRMIPHISMTDYISNEGPARIDFSISVERLRDDGAAVNGANSNFGVPLDGADFPTAGYDSRDSKDPGVSGTLSLLGAIKTALHSICTTSVDIATRNYSPYSSGDIVAVPDDPTGMPTVTVSTAANGSTTAPDYLSTDMKSAIYTDYQIESRWETTENRIQLPIAGQSSVYSSGAATCAVVGLGMPMTTRTIRIAATRVGSVPKIQEPKSTWTTGSGSTEMVFTKLKEIVLPMSPERDVQGVKVFTVRADYVYAVSRNPLSSEALPIGIDPSWVGSAGSLTAGSRSTFDEQSTIS